MIVIIDNYDSFTYNLYQYIGEIREDVEVYRNDEISIEELEKLNPSHIILSPGPGFPVSAGITIDVAKRLGHKIPVLGVCLGHQAIGEAFGGKVVHAEEMMHGKSSNIEIDNSCPVFKGLGKTIQAGRYHSLIVRKEDLPNELLITAKTDTGEIMGLRHKEFKVFGIQFHPESVLTPEGKSIIKNFLEI